MSIIIPVIQTAEIERLQQAKILSLYEIWRSEYEARQPKFIVENIRFHHDPYWRNRTFSIQNARDGNSWFWKATHVVVRIGIPIASAAWPFLFS